MDSASKELAVTRQIEAVGGVGSRRNDSLWIWIIIIVIIFCFLNGDGFGFGGWGGDYDYGRRHRCHRHRRNNNFFGENGWFILIIFAVLFLFNDSFGGANTNIINVDTDEEGL